VRVTALFELLQIRWVDKIWDLYDCRRGSSDIRPT